MKGSGGVGRGGGVGGRGARRGGRGERLLLPLCSAHEEGVMTNYLHEKAHKSLRDDRAEGAAFWLEKNGRKTKGHKHSDRLCTSQILQIVFYPCSVFMWNKNLQYTRNSHIFPQFHTLCNQFSRNALISFRVQDLCCKAIFWKINTVHVLTHHWEHLPFHTPVPSSCRARAPEPPAACVEGWSPHHPAGAEQTQM